jgi:hypothetical protein
LADASVAGSPFLAEVDICITSIAVFPSSRLHNIASDERCQAFLKYLFCFGKIYSNKPVKKARFLGLKKPILTMKMR